MNNNPVVSIITTVHNEEKFISSAIESILNQSFYDYEFLIVDDASDDNTFDIIFAYSKFDSRIHIFQNKDNKGRSFSRNVALANTKGKYVMIFDGDDISANNRIETQLKFLQRNPDIDYVGSDCYYISQSNEISKPNLDLPLNHFDIYWKLFFSYPFYHTTTFGKRNLFIKAGGYPNELIVNEDIVLWMKMLNLGAKFANISERLAYYRIYEIPFHYLLNGLISKYVHKGFMSCFLNYEISPNIYNIIWETDATNLDPSLFSASNYFEAIQCLLDLYERFQKFAPDHDMYKIASSIENKLELILNKFKCNEIEENYLSLNNYSFNYNNPAS